MVSIGGNVRPTVGDAALQHVSGITSIAITNPSLVVTSGHQASGIAVGGVLVSGRVVHSETGFLPFNFSGTTIWIPYWVSGSP